MLKNYYCQVNDLKIWWKWSITMCLFTVTIISCQSETLPVDEVAKAYSQSTPIVPMAEYTADNAREWQDLADEHVPKISRSIYQGKPALLVEVPLAKASMSHYIEKIGILDEKGKDLMVVTLERQANPKTFTYFLLNEIPQSNGLKVFVKCNLHDLWTAQLDLDNLKTVRQKQLLEVEKNSAKKIQKK